MTSAKIHLHQLRHFVSAAELGTISAAAQSLRVSQPTVTISIAKLEDAVGAKLLHRDHRGVRVTSAGNILLAGARDILGKLDESIEGIARLKGVVAKNRSNVVRLGLMPQISQVLLTPLIEQRVRRHPDVDLVIEESPGKNLIKMLEVGEIDLAVSNVDGSSRLIAAEPVVVQEFHLMGSRKMIGGNAPILFADLHDYPLIQGAMDGSMERRQTLEGLATTKGINLNFDVNSPVTIRKQLMQTLSRCSVSLYFLFMHEIAEGEISARPIREPMLVQYLYLMRRKRSSPRSAERTVYDLVKSQFGRMIRQGRYRWHRPDWRAAEMAVELDAVGIRKAHG